MTLLWGVLAGPVTSGSPFHHPDVGLLEVVFDVFEMPGEHGLSIVTYSVEPGTPSADAMALLASLTATTATRHTSEVSVASPESSRPT